MSRKIGFQESLENRQFWPWERKQVGQDFLVVGKHHRVKVSCIMLCVAVTI